MNTPRIFVKTQNLINLASIKLATKGFETPRLDVELLLCHTFSCERIDLYKKKYELIDSQAEKQFQFFLERRLKSEPIAYILGYKEFYGYPFQVNQATLIPRPETELLVKEASDFLQENPWAKNIIDLGTGTGCLGITLALLHKKIKVKAIDVAEETLKKAKENAKNLRLDKNQIDFDKKDILDKEFWSQEKTYDLIISNPPYIGREEQGTLSPEVLQHEPRKALFADKNGLEFYYTYAKYGKHILADKGQMFLELSPIIYHEVCRIFLSFDWRVKKTIIDYGGHRRHIIVY